MTQKYRTDKNHHKSAIYVSNKDLNSTPSFLLKTRAIVCVSGRKKCSFFGKFGVLCFLETFVLRFALLPYYRRYRPQVNVAAMSYTTHTHPKTQKLGYFSY